MKRQTLAIILILIAGGTSTAFAVTNGSIITGDLTVTGTCTGCGGGEGSFTNYNIIALNTTAGSAADSGIANIYISNIGDINTEGFNRNLFVLMNGTVRLDSTGSAFGGSHMIDQSSATGQYKVEYDRSTNLVKIYKGSNFLQSLGINNAQFAGATLNTNSVGIAISPNGKFIGILGQDSGGTTDRVIIFQGSP